MKKFINVKINNQKDVELFAEFCKKKGICDMYDSQNKIFPHFRVICFYNAQSPISFWEIDETWTCGNKNLESGIYVNGGGLFNITELENQYDDIKKRMEELVWKRTSL